MKCFSLTRWSKGLYQCYHQPTSSQIKLVQRIQLKNNSTSSTDHHISADDNPPTEHHISADDNPPWRLLFLGTDNFALPHLKLLNETRLNNKKLIQSIDVFIPCAKCPVQRYAEEEGLTVHSWPFRTNSQYDLGIVVSFGHLIPNRVIKTCKLGMLNVHPSLLPRWRGASPILHTLLNGDTHTGISIIKIRPKKFDHGPILVQQQIPIPQTATALDLQESLSSHASVMLLECIKSIANQTHTEQPKDIDLPYAHKFNVNHMYIDWRSQGPCDIDRQYRALGVIFSLRTCLDGHLVKLKDMINLDAMKDIQLPLNDNTIPGTAVFDRHSNTILIKCKVGWVAFRTLVYRKPLSATEFYNGYLSKNRTVTFESRSNGLDRYIHGT